MRSVYYGNRRPSEYGPGPGSRNYCERGIVVNDTLQSYDPSIYAVGECIQHRGDTFGLVAPLFEQAKVCANHLSGHGTAEYITLPTATKLKVTASTCFLLAIFRVMKAVKVFILQTLL